MKKYVEPVLHFIGWGIILGYFLQTGYNFIRTCQNIKITSATIDIESLTLRQNQGVNDWRNTVDSLHKETNPDFWFYKSKKTQNCEEITFYDGQIVLPLSLGLFFKILLVYGLAIWLIPKYLAEKKYVFFILLAMFFSAGLLGLELLLDYFYINFRGQLIYPDGFKPNNFQEVQRVQLRAYPLFIIGAFLYRFAKDWWYHQNLQKKLQAENLQTELNFLKSQINPHFLFNTLNNLYGLALTQKADKTAEGIAKLAKQMRYMLYESNVDMIEISTEVAYIQTFIDLQKLRLSEIDDIKINFKSQGNVDSYKIAPMLLIPFVENAFKHSLTFTKAIEIDIDLQVADNQLIFKVKNTINPHLKSELDEPSGLGLQNVQRRLELLYPQKFDLQIQKSEDWFEIFLKINL
jgi:hypothetical protein